VLLLLLLLSLFRLMSVLTQVFECLVVVLVLQVTLALVPSAEKERLLLEKRREQGTVAQP
jgi:hypothetical protein